MNQIDKIKARITQISQMAAQYAHLEKKDKDGKSSKAEIKKKLFLHQELEAFLEPIPRSNLLCGVHDIADIFAVSIRTVQKWVSSKGCPKVKHGIFDIPVIFAWWNENINNVSDAKTEQTLREEYLKEQIRNAKLKADATEGILVSRDEVLAAWANRIRSVWGMLYLLENRLPPVLHGKSISEMQEIIKAEVRAVNEFYCRHGKHCEAQAQDGKVISDGKRPPAMVARRKRGRPRKAV